MKRLLLLTLLLAGCSGNPTLQPEIEIVPGGVRVNVPTRTNLHKGFRVVKKGQTLWVRDHVWSGMDTNADWQYWEVSTKADRIVLRSNIFERVQQEALDVHGVPVSTNSP